MSKVEQQSNLKVSSPKVIEKLPCICVHQSLGCLELDDDLVLYQHELRLQEESVRVRPRAFHPCESAMTLLVERNRSHAFRIGNTR